MALTTENSKVGGVQEIRISVVFLKIGAAVVVLLLAGVFVWYFAIRPTSDFATVASSSKATKVIHITYPSDWTVVSARSVLGAPSDAVIVLQRKDKSGVLVVLPGGKAPALDTASSNEIGRQLSKDYADYKFVNSAIVQLKGERALFFTYLRTKQGDVHTITILPVGRSSFVIESASPSSNGKVGKEIGDILKSATISPRS